MHPLRHPRNAAMVGILFVVIGVIYYAVPTLQAIPAQAAEVASGTTMLIFLGVAMALMAYVLVAGSSKE
jgi:hypothetical protein